MAAAKAGLKGATNGAALTAMSDISFGIIFLTNFFNELPKPKFSLGVTFIMPPAALNCLFICDLDIAII